MSHELIRRLALALLAALAWAGVPRPAAASDLRPQMKELAKDVHQLLTGRGDSAVAVGAFTGPPSTSAGPGVAQLLTEELKKLSMAVRPGAKLGVKGEYSFGEIDAEDGKGKLLVAKIQATVVDKLGNTLANIPFERTIQAEADIAHLAGTPVTLPGARASGQQRDQALRKAIVDPHTDVRGTRVAAGDKFAIEILVNGKPAVPGVEDGLAFVPIGRASAYAVRLINDSDHDAAVRLTIDGISVFAFSKVCHASGDKKGEPLYNVFLVKAHDELLVPGWHVTNDHSDQFVVTEFAKSAAAELKSDLEVGTITASFSAAWEGDRPPADEPGSTRGGGGDATGRGPSVDNKLKEVVRTVGVVRASTSVRYTK